ncbi:MAG TPA: hypothetical protein VFE44_06585 [Thermoanaerobaculia bacterium]|nr:hypothetical protein [Thermoanaerobaculia bacterium]
MVEGDRLTADPLAWLQARSNEHRITLPLLLWTANIHLTRGDNRGLSALSLAVLVATFAVLCWLLPRDVRAAPGGRALFATLLSLLVFTPVAAHNWVLGFSGNQWFLANLSAIGAIALLVRLRPGAALGALAPVVLVGAVGAFCHGTHLALWPALVVGSLLLPTPRGAPLVLGVSGAAAAAFFSWGFGSPSRALPPAADAPSAFDFFRSYLGLLMTRDPERARHWGTLAVALGVAAVVAALAARSPERRRERLPWLLVLLYAAGNALGTSIGRARLGAQIALSSRYASLPALFWAAALVLLGLAVWQWEPRRPASRWAARAAFAAFALATLLPTLAVGRARLEAYLARGQRHPLAALALLWRVEDTTALRTLTPAIEQLDWTRDFFVRVRHVPFDRAGDWPLGSSIEAPRAGGAPAGRWESAAPVAAGFLGIVGLVNNEWDGAERRQRVLLLDASGALRGGGVFVPRPRAPRPLLLRRAPLPFRWEGYLQRGCHGEITAWLELRGSSELYPLRRTAGIDKVLAAEAAACAQPVPGYAGLVRG